MSDTREEDCWRIRGLAKHHGFAISVRDARAIWEEHSAGAWLPLPEKDGDLFTVLLGPLHDWLAENGEPPPPATQGVMARVPIIDEAEGPCEICAAWAAVKYVQPPEGERGPTRYRCDQCGQIIENYGAMRGRGFSGITPHHMHLRPVKDTLVQGRAAVVEEFCLDCYRKHRQAVYPNESPKELERHLRV